MGSSSYSYEVVSSAFNEDFYEQCVIEQYLQFMYERLLIMRELLSEKGSD